MHRYINCDHRAVKWLSKVHSSPLGETLHPLSIISLFYVPPLLTPHAPKPVVTAVHCSMTFGFQAFTYECDHSVFVFLCLAHSNKSFRSSHTLSTTVTSSLLLSSGLLPEIYVSSFQTLKREPKKHGNMVSV